MKAFPFAAALGLALSLGACSMPELTRKAPTCPETGFLSAAQMATYTMAGETAAKKPDEQIVEAKAALVDYRGDCAFARGKTTVDLAVTLAAEKGPGAGEAQTLNFEWFAALTDASGNIAQKQIFSTAVAFDEQGHGQTDEEIQFIIPAATAEDAAGYKIILGLQLSKEQIDFNRKGISP